jgi:hypothetical protein
MQTKVNAIRFVQISWKPSSLGFGIDDCQKIGHLATGSVALAGFRGLA